MSKTSGKGYWTWDWSDSYQRVQRLDHRHREVELAEPHHSYGYTRNQRFCFLNILEEVTRPGDWCLDRANGILYFWPPEDLQDGDLQDGDLEVSVLTAPLIDLTGTSWVRLEGLHLARSLGCGVRLTGGRDNLVAGCALTHLGGDAVVIDGGRGNGVQSCDIADVALKGIVLSGGDRRTLEPAGNFAVNNHIQRFNQWVRTYQWAVDLGGVGNRVAHNRICDAPHEGIYLRGNDHVIELNEFYDLMQETGDSGAIHTGRDLTWRGNTIRHNYFHHLKGVGLHGVVAIYLDDFSCDFTVYGNICYQAGRGVLIGGGRDNRVEGNLFVECQPAVHIDARGLSWAAYYYDSTYDVLRQLLAEVKGLEPPYSERYPELLTYYDGEAAVPKNNHIVGNLSCGGRWLDRYDYFTFDPDLVTIEGNWIADEILCRRLARPPQPWDPYYLDMDGEDYLMLGRDDPRGRAELAGNRITDEDPRFVDPEAGDFRLRDDSPALGLGFESIPVAEMGLELDAFRHCLPGG